MVMQVLLFTWRAGQDHKNRDVNHDFRPGFSLLL